MGTIKIGRCSKCGDDLVIRHVCGVGENKSTLEVKKEYCRRNLVAAKACGVRAGLKTMVERLHSNKNSPLWLISIAKNELGKTQAICHELATHRDELNYIWKRG